MAVNTLKENQYYNVVKDYQKESSKLQRTLNTSNTSTDNNVFEDIAKSYNINAGIAKDGVNDGKISTGDKVKNFLKGAWNGLKGMVKGAIKHPIKTALMIGACCIPGVGPFIAGGLAAYGIVKGTAGIVKSAKAAHNATTDAEAEAAWQGIGTGSFQVGISVIAAKGAVKTIKANNAALAEAGNSAIADNAGILGKATGSVKNGFKTLENSSVGKAVVESTGKFSESYKAAKASGKGRLESLYEGAKGTKQGYADYIKQNTEFGRLYEQSLKGTGKDGNVTFGDRISAAKESINKIGAEKSADVRFLQEQRAKLAERYERFSNKAKELEAAGKEIPSSAKSALERMEAEISAKDAAILRTSAQRILQMKYLTKKYIQNGSKTKHSLPSFETVKAGAKALRNDVGYKTLRTPAYAVFASGAEDETEQYIY